MVRLNKLVKEFNVSIDRIFAFLETRGVQDLKPNSKVSHDIYMELLGEFDSEKAKLSAALLAKEKELAKAEEIIKQNEIELKDQDNLDETKSAIDKVEIHDQKIVENDLQDEEKRISSDDVEIQPSIKNQDDKLIKANAGKLKGVTKTGEKIDLDKFKAPEKNSKKEKN